MIEVTLITGSACRPCEKVKVLLEALRAEYPEMRVTELDLGTREGTALAIRYRLGALPGIMINGRMALVGEVSERLLRGELDAARATARIRA